jgi:hypothetical protein
MRKVGNPAIVCLAVIGELKVVKSGRFETRRLFGLVLIVSFDRLVLPGVFPSYNKWLRGG